MPVGQCPRCSYPVDSDERDRRTCPACGASLRDLVPFQPAVRRTAPSPARRFGSWWLAALAFLASFAAGIGLMHPPPTPPESPSEGSLIAAGAAMHPREAEKPPAPPAEPPMPPRKPAEPKAPPRREAPRKEPNPPPVAPRLPPPPEVLTGDDRRLHRPDGEYRLGSLTAGTTLRLSGKVKTLTIARVGNRSTLDASALEAQEVFFTDRIDGASTVKLRAPQGRIDFRSRVDGGSRLEIDAPGGTVVFREPPPSDPEDMRIDGGSHVAVTARVADFRGDIGGKSTRILVTLTRGGILSFRDLAGSVCLQYRKADRRDPDPRVLGGMIHGVATVQQID